MKASLTSRKHSHKFYFSLFLMDDNGKFIVLLKIKMLIINSLIIYAIFMVIRVDSSVANSSVLKWKKIVFKGISPYAPPQRRDCAIGYDAKNDNIVLFGGRSSSTVFLDTWFFNNTNQSWYELPKTNNIPPGIYAGIHGSNENGFTIAFGRGASNAIINDVYRFDFNSSKWSIIAVKGDKPKQRYHTSGGFMNDNLFVSHGRSESALLSDTQQFDFADAKWKLNHADINQYSPLLPHARYGQAGIILPTNKFLMFGGCLSGEKSAGPCPSSDSWIFDARTKQWKNRKSCSSPRLYAAMALLPNGTEKSTVAVLFGGEEVSKQTVTVHNKASNDEVSTFDTKSGKWERTIIQQDPNHGFPEMRFGHCMTTTATGIAVFGGISIKNGQLLNDLWLLEGDAKASRNSPKKDDCSSYVNLITVHAILMFLSWGVILQFAAFVARYLKNKETIWYNLHRVLAMFGLAIAIAGFIIGILSIKGKQFSFVHGAIGLDIMLAGLYQPLNAAFRPAAPKEGEKPKLWRRIWEISHKFTGRIALLLSLANISLGLFLSVASKSIWITWFCYIAVIIIVYLMAEFYSRKKARQEKNTIQVDSHMQEIK